jgi:hypothetical protein
MAYSGEPILAHDLLFGPQHSIIDQSLHADLGMGVTTNGDGFGIGWYREGGAAAPTVFKSHLALRVIAGALAEPARLAADLDTERARVRADLDDLRAVRAMLDPIDPVFGWAWVVATWGERYFRDMIGQLFQCQLATAFDHGQQIVEIVSDAARELAHRFHLL